MKRTAAALVLILILISSFFIYKHFTAISRTFEWKEGDKRSWSYDLTVRTVSKPVGAVSLDSLIKYSGRLNIKVAKASKGTATLFVQLSDIAMTSNGQKTPDTAKLFGTPYLVDVTNRGEFSNFRFAGGLEENLTLTMGQTLKIFMTVLDDKDKWSRTESFVDETSLVDYRVHKGLVRKVKNEFIKSTFIDDGYKPYFVSSLLVSKVSKEGIWLDNAVMQEHVMVDDQNGRMLYEIKSKGELKPAVIDNPNLDVWRDGLTVMMIEKALKDTTPARPKAESKISAQYNSIIENNQQTATPAAILNMYITDMSAMQDVPRNFTKDLVFYLQENKELYKELNQYMTGTPEHVQRLIPYMLEMDGSPEAQAALISITEDLSLSEVNRSRGLVALAGVKQPEAETIEQIWDIYRSTAGEKNIISSTALLTLGTLAGTQQDGEVKEQTLELLRGEAGLIGKSESTGSIMIALSNSHREEFITDIASVFDDNDSMYKRAAAEALAGIDAADSAKALYAEYEAAETEPAVRLEIIKSFSKMTNTEIFDRHAYDLLISSHDQAEQTELAKYISQKLKLNDEQKSNIKHMLDSTPAPETLKYLIKIIKN